VLTFCLIGWNVQFKIDIICSWKYGVFFLSNPIEDKPIIPNIVDEFTWWWNCSNPYYEVQSKCKSRTVGMHTLRFKRGNNICNKTLSHHQLVQLQCRGIEAPYLRGTMHPLQQWMLMAFEGWLQQSQTSLGDQVHWRTTYMFLYINFPRSLQSGFNSLFRLFSI